MDEVRIHWEQVVSLTKALGALGPELTRDEQATLEGVFEVAGRALNDSGIAQTLDAAAVPGGSADGVRTVFKIVYPMLPYEDRKPPECPRCGTELPGWRPPKAAR